MLRLSLPEAGPALRAASRRRCRYACPGWFVPDVCKNGAPGCVRTHRRRPGDTWTSPLAGWCSTILPWNVFHSAALASCAAGFRSPVLPPRTFRARGRRPAAPHRRVSARHLRVCRISRVRSRASRCQADRRLPSQQLAHAGSRASPLTSSPGLHPSTESFFS